jgi:hypothetical protein
MTLTEALHQYMAMVVARYPTLASYSHDVTISDEGVEMRWHCGADRWVTQGFLPDELQDAARCQVKLGRLGQVLGTLEGVR